MNNLTKSQTNRLLGYPADARLLMINADDFGMCNSINEAIFGALMECMVRSTSLMVTCPWALQAMNLLSNRPDIPFGVHLTVICDADNYRWGPITSKEKVLDLVDRGGSFYSKEDFPTFLDQDILDQLPMQFEKVDVLWL